MKAQCIGWRTHTRGHWDELMGLSDEWLRAANLRL
jgi:hypothetical protein